MKSKIEQLEIQFKDYHRFIGVLLIASCYLYMGAMINVYIRPTSDGALLCHLSLLSVMICTCFAFKLYKIKIQIEENERV